MKWWQIYTSRKSMVYEKINECESVWIWVWVALSVLLGMPGYTNVGHPATRKVSPTQGVAYPGVLLIPMTKAHERSDPTLWHSGLWLLQCPYSCMFHSCMELLDQLTDHCVVYIFWYLCDKGLAHKQAKLEFAVQITTSYTASRYSHMLV